MPYNNATICLNGHIVSKYDAHAQKHCTKCGAETYSYCLKCNSPILYLQGTGIPEYKRKDIKQMIDVKQQNHDLAVVAAAISAYKNFDSEIYGSTPSLKRSAFAEYLKDEYEFYLKYYTANS